MKVNIIRGKNQIGGNIIEISTEKTKILLDAGLELDGGNTLPDIRGLFDYAGYDAIFVSHYHSDHLGLVYRAHKGISVYMGEGCYKIVSASDRYKKRESITPKGFLRHRQKIVIGDITVTPFLCDHSAFDSYMLLCEAYGESVLYTGDFRSNGRKPFEWLLNSLPRKVDKLICEGTTLSREGYVPQTETALEEKASKLFSETRGPVFVLQSSVNIDRIVTMYCAAKGRENGTSFPQGSVYGGNCSGGRGTYSKSAVRGRLCVHNESVHIRIHREIPAENRQKRNSPKALCDVRQDFHAGLSEIPVRAYVL